MNIGEWTSKELISFGYLGFGLVWFSFSIMVSTPAICCGMVWRRYALY